MTPLYFLLEVCAVVLAAGVTSSLLGVGLVRFLQPRLSTLSSTRRADVLFLLAMLPVVACLVVAVGTAAPPILALFGIAEDHCGGHSHHAHLCIVHSTELRPLIAIAGTVGLVAFLYRCGALVLSAATTMDSVRRLEQLGSLRCGRFPSVVVPAPMFHALGTFRRRILVSDEFAKVLTPRELQAALAHEEAHLDRRDPMALSCLRLAALFALPAAARALATRFRRAIEEAADARAVSAVADPSLVAVALVKVAALQRHSGSAIACSAAPAFGQTCLEERVRLLLDNRAVGTAKPLAFAVAAFTLLVAVSLALLQAPALHHTVETTLSHF